MAFLQIYIDVTDQNLVQQCICTMALLMCFFLWPQWKSSCVSQEALTTTALKEQDKEVEPLSLFLIIAMAL